MSCSNQVMLVSLPNSSKTRPANKTQPDTSHTPSSPAKVTRVDVFLKMALQDMRQTKIKCNGPGVIAKMIGVGLLGPWLLYVECQDLKGFLISSYMFSNSNETIQAVGI